MGFLAHSDDLNSVVEHHTVAGQVTLSGGAGSDIYLDLRAALLCPRCRGTLLGWYESMLPNLTVVGTGAFGALLLSALCDYERPCLLWNPKKHGLAWSGNRPRPGEEVILVDDVVSTGETLSRLREACEREGWVVRGEIVAVRRANSENTSVSREAAAYDN